MLIVVACCNIISIGIFLPVDAVSPASFVATNIRIDNGGGGLKYSHNGHHAIQFLRNTSPHNRIINRGGGDANRWKLFLHTSNPNSSRRRQTYLASTPASLAPNIAAGSTLILSSLSGILFEKNISKSSGGHVITLLTAALLSNISQVVVSRMKGIPILFSIPTDNFLYDWCWSIFLPSSLVLALLSSSSSPTLSSPSIISTDSSYDDATNSTLKRTSRPIKSTILGMTLPFMAGTIGSIIGCLASFRFIAMPHAKSTSALLAGCLCASYIGGTVNFFATAKVLKDIAINGGSDASMGSAFGSMAAADLVVMAFYFAMLSAASKSAWLHRLFPSKLGDDGGDVMEKSGDGMYSENVIDEYQSTSVEPTTKTSNRSTVTATILASSMAIASVFVATRFEQKVTNSFPPPFNPPGTMCAFLAIIGLLLERLIGFKFSCKKAKTSPIPPSISLHLSNSLQKISMISPILSDVCFYLLFAAVGATADLSSAFSGGPTALVFASLALIIHAITVILVSSTGIRLGDMVVDLIKRKMGTIPNKKLLFHWPRSSWQEVLTASNAAIGGPSSAAAFAAGLVPRNNHIAIKTGNVDGSRYRSALVIAATFWGVFGYAIATGIGVTVSRILMR